ncbi:hypothetical protein AAFN88_03965 [Pelagibius sp. CAU 1746]|uniref:hypothetical protein n=1 Tax=Pelagibius sp. CAU 1746 TaxID=3140370 RepID=UPI00325BBAE4
MEAAADLTLWEFLALYAGEHGLAGCIGAGGHQVLYWGNRLRSSGSLRFRVLVYSVLYTVTGSGVGHFVGSDGGSTLLALGAGFGWPAFIQSINAAKQISQRFFGGEGGDSPAGAAGAGGS